MGLGFAQGLCKVDLVSIQSRVWRQDSQDGWNGLAGPDEEMVNRCSGRRCK